MRRLLFTTGFVVSLALAACSFGSLMGEDNANSTQLAQQSFFVPKSGTAGIDECLIDHSSCGQSAASSICEAKGFTRVISFGEAAAEDMTGSIDAPVKAEQKSAPKKEMPLLVTCGR